MFSKTSRYLTIPTLEHQGPGGRTIRYKDVRFTPRTRVAGRHVVDEGERTDHIAARHLRDPTRYWRLCDANRILWPDDLTVEPGRAVAVPPPEG